MSLRRLARKIRLFFRKPPRSARDLVSSYDEYLRLQRDRHLSHESEVNRWAEGQRRFVATAFSAAPRDARVLDCGCGDGVGLEALRSLGFEKIAGVELSPLKAARARRLGFRVEELDMHDLSLFGDGAFQAILCSHALEHAYDPGLVLKELHRLLSPGGTLHVVLPYPDPGPRNELAHTAKYELGTDRDDGGEIATRFFLERGFDLISSRRDAFREPELWLMLRKGAGVSPR
jgi:SAM-dependent methyltransferase